MVIRTNGWGSEGVFTFCSANIVRAHVGAIRTLAGPERLARLEISFG